MRPKPSIIADHLLTAVRACLSLRGRDAAVRWLRACLRRDSRDAQARLPRACLRMRGRDAVDRLLRACPRACALCGMRVRGAFLCEGCRRELAATMHASQPRCPRCALRLGLDDCACPDCARRQPALDATVAAFDYEAPGDLLIARLKQELRFELAGTLASLLADRLALPEAPSLPAGTLIVPIPAAAASLRRRGFNPAAEIARALAYRTGHAFSPCLRRTGQGPRQSSLGGQARRQGASGGFALADAGLPSRATSFLPERTPGHTPDHAPSHASGDAPGDAPGDASGDAPGHAPGRPSERLPRGEQGCVIRGATIALVDDVMTTGSTLDAAARVLRAAGAVRIIGIVAARTPDRRGSMLAQYRLP
jgi:predicted amidophosphoribosyltransferase